MLRAFGILSSCNMFSASNNINNNNNAAALSLVLSTALRSMVLHGGGVVMGQGWAGLLCGGLA